MNTPGRWIVAAVGTISSLLVSLCLMGVPALAQSAGVSIGVGDTSFTVQGYTSPGAQVTIIDGGSTIGSVVADGSGAYSQHFTAQTAGLHNLQVYALDKAGRSTNTVSIQVNVTEHAETVVDLFLPPTIQLSSSAVLQGETITLTGEGTPNTTIIIYIDNTYVTTSVDGSGYWRYDISTTTLQPGQHQLFAIAQQSNASQSYPTASQPFIIRSITPQPQPQPPTGQPGAGGQVPKVPIILQPKPGTVANDRSIEVSGIAESGVWVEVWNNGKLVGAIFADGSGRWRLFIQLFDSTNNIKVRACTGHICSNFSDIVTVLFQPQFQEQMRFLLKDYVYRAGVWEQVTLQAVVSHGHSPYTYVIDWGDGDQETIKTSSKEPNFSHHFERPGRYNGTITVTDARGERASLSFVTMVDSEEIPLWMIILLLLLLLLLLLRRRRKKRAKKDSELAKYQSTNSGL